MKRLVSLAALAALLAPKALACAEAWDWEGGGPVPVAREDVLISWDPAAGQEQFTRRIAFGSAKDDFAFLVPLPSVPHVAEADPRVFDRLADASAPVKIYLPDTFWLFQWIAEKLMSMSSMSLGAAEDLDSPPAVRVLGVAKVAGQVATTLQASDTKALERWLKTNGYRTRPGLTSWLEKYVADKWTIVAFKYDPAAKNEPLDTKAVTLSFRTTTPFFPYREPADQRETSGGPRLLKVYFVGPDRVFGRIGEGLWPGNEVYANQVDGRITAGSEPSRVWLTVFEDKSSPRPGTDELYFAKNASTFARIPTETVWVPLIPLEPLFLALIALAPGLIYYRRRRKARKKR